MRLRLLAVIVGVVGLVLLVHDLPLAGHLQQVERDRLVTKLERDAFILAGRFEEALEDGTATDDPVLERLVSDYSNAEGVRVVVVDARAVGVSGSDLDRTVGLGFANRPEIGRALEGFSNSGERSSDTLGESLFYVAVPVLSGDEVIGAVRLSTPGRVVGERAGSRVQGLFVVAAISLAIAAAAAWFVSLMITKPLAALRDATRALANGDLRARADVDGGPPELRQLASSFNSMADRLQLLVERQRAFAGTASHQLRTPLTALQLRLEQLEAQVEDRPRARAQLESALAECDRLHRMVEGLLALSRAEAEQVDLGRVDLAASVTRRVEQWQALAEENEVTIEATISSERPILAAAGSVEQIIDNLIDNALAVSPRGGRVGVLVGDEQDRGGADRIALHVVDEGPGLAPDERVEAFDRFWRGPSAAPGGTGLGLAIVKQLTQLGGGTARLDEAPGGGIEAVVTFQPLPVPSQSADDSMRPPTSSRPPEGQTDRR